MKKYYVKPTFEVMVLPQESMMEGSDPEKGYKQEGPYTDGGIDVKEGDADVISGRAKGAFTSWASWDDDDEF